jgi:alpha-1,2-mannosyltransferase
VTEQLDPTLPRQRVALPSTISVAAPAPPAPSLVKIDRWWLIGGIVAAALIIAALLGPWGSRMIDLEVYRVGASALLSGKDIYTVSEPSSGLVFTYPVFAAVVFAPFVVVSTPVAQIAILAISLAALWAIVHLTVLAVRSAVGATRGSAIAWSVPLSVMAVASHPALETLLFGQINLILTALVLADVLPRERGHSRGVLVGIAAGIKLVPAIFIIYFLVTGQRRAAATALLTTLGTVAIGFLVQPTASWAYWTSHAIDPDRMGGIAYVTNQSILGMSARLLRDPHPPRAFTLTMSAIVVAAAILLARRLVQRGDRFTAVCVVATASLLASPIAWSHHWVWFVPCLGTLTVWALQPPGTGRWWRWTVVGVATAILVSGPMQFMPKTGLRELDHTLPQEFVANIYGLLAVLYLGWAVLRAWRPVASTRTLVGHPPTHQA